MYYVGRSGYMTIGDSGDIINLRDWTINSALEPIEVTHLGHEARKYVKGLKSATGSFTIFYHNDNNQVQQILDDCINTDIGQAAAQRYILKWGTGSTQKKIDFFAFLTGVTLSMQVNDVLKAECTFQMTGNYQTITL